MNADRHITDGDLIGLLDGEARAGRSAIETHVDTCSACTARLAQLQLRSAQVSKLLRAVDLPPVESTRLLSSARNAAMRRPRRRLWSHAGFRAAAGVVLVAGIAAASPVRGWILDRMIARRSTMISDDGRSPTPVPARDPAQSSGSVVRFSADLDQLLVRFAAAPSAGTLTIVAGTDSLSSAQIISGAHGEGFLVLPHELHVRNESGSRAHYQMIVSPAIRRVLVQVGDASRRETTTVHVAPGLRQTLQLGSPENRR